MFGPPQLLGRVVGAGGGEDPLGGGDEVVAGGGCGVFEECLCLFGAAVLLGDEDASAAGGEHCFVIGQLELLAEVAGRVNGVGAGDGLGGLGAGDPGQVLVGLVE